MIYEIVNMSDHYTIVCPSLEIATVACCLLGRGQYMFRPDNLAAELRVAKGEPPYPEVPFFMFGGVDDFCQKHFSQTFEALMDDVMTHHKDVLADAFDSVVIGNRADYQRALAFIAEADHAAFRAKWHAEKLTSMNDIGGRAYEIAAKLRAGTVTHLPKAPAQVFIT